MSTPRSRANDLAWNSASARNSLPRQNASAARSARTSQAFEHPTAFNPLAQQPASPNLSTPRNRSFAFVPDSARNVNRDRSNSNLTDVSGKKRAGATGIRALVNRARSNSFRGNNRPRGNLTARARMAAASSQAAQATHHRARRMSLRYTNSMSAADMRGLRDATALQARAYETFTAYAVARAAALRCQKRTCGTWSKERSAAAMTDNDRGENSSLDLSDDEEMAQWNDVEKAWRQVLGLRARSLELAHVAKDASEEWCTAVGNELCSAVQETRGVFAVAFDAGVGINSSPVRVARQRIGAALNRWKKSVQETQARQEDVAAELREDVELMIAVQMLAEQQASELAGRESTEDQTLADLYAESVERMLLQMMSDASCFSEKVKEANMRCREALGTKLATVLEEDFDVMQLTALYTGQTASNMQSENDELMLQGKTLE